MEDNYIDINYNVKIKGKYTVEEIYTKIKNHLKKNKIWNCEKSDTNIIIKFNDNVSDDFVLDTNKKFSGYCRIRYEEDIVDSTLEKLLDMLFSIKSIFSILEVYDDYSICESYLKNKAIKIKLIDLTEKELEKVKNIYDEGYNDYRSFLLMCIAKDLNLKSHNDLYINSNVIEFTYYDKIEKLYENLMLMIFETWLYETTIYKTQDRFYKNQFYNINNKVEYKALGAVSFDMYALCNGVLSIISKEYRKNSSFGVRDANVQKFYREKVLDMLKQEENNFEQCVIAYKYLKSILEYTGFTFVGKDEITNADKHCTKVKYLDDSVSIIDALNYIICR